MGRSMEVVRQLKIKVPDLPKKLKDLRMQDGRSVQTLATLAGISTAYWYQIENDKRQWISEETLKGMEKALGVDMGIQFTNDIA